MERNALLESAVQRVRQSMKMPVWCFKQSIDVLAAEANNVCLRIIPRA